MNRKCHEVGVFSPAGGGADGNWLNGHPNFKFSTKMNRFLYISEGKLDVKKVHAKLYGDYFKESNSPVDIFKTIKNGRHDRNAFTVTFVDFILQNVFPTTSRISECNFNVFLKILKY